MILPQPAPVAERSGVRWDGCTGRSRTVTVQGHDIHGLEFGAGERTLLLLHGLSGSSRWWRRNVPALARRFRVLVPDLVGFGRSRAPGRVPGPERLARLLLTWAQHSGADRLHLVGHSMGGQIAIHLAARHPEQVERLVLVDAAGIPRPLTPAFVIRFATEIAPLWRWGDPRFLPTIVSDAWTAGPRTIVRAIGHIVRDDVRPLLPRIQVPTLVVWGERDRWVPLSHGWEMRTRIPEARLAVLRGAGHHPMVDRAADFNRLLTRFVDGESIGQ